MSFQPGKVDVVKHLVAEIWSFSDWSWCKSCRSCKSRKRKSRGFAVFHQVVPIKGKYLFWGGNGQWDHVLGHVPEVTECTEITNFKLFLVPQPLSKLFHFIEKCREVVRQLLYQYPSGVVVRVYNLWSLSALLIRKLFSPDLILISSFKKNQGENSDGKLWVLKFGWGDGVHHMLQLTVHTLKMHSCESNKKSFLSAFIASQPNSWFSFSSDDKETVEVLKCYSRALRLDKWKNRQNWNIIIIDRLT